MNGKDALEKDLRIPRVGGTSQALSRLDAGQRLLALGLEISKRAAELRSLDDLYFFLVNDLRTLIEFDRCSLITHMGGYSRFVAANNQPLLEKKSKLYAQIDALAPLLKQLNKGILLSAGAEDQDFPMEEVSDDFRAAMKSYMKFSGPNYLLCVPLVHNNSAIAHVLLEFFGDKAPGELETLAVLNIAPLFASVLAEKWLLHKKPDMFYLISPEPHPKTGSINVVTRHWKPITVGIALAMALLFYFPLDYTVGGEAVISPWERHLAFCKSDGLIEKTFVTEGSHVETNQVLAALDPNELKYKIDSAERQAEILARKITLLSRESDTTPDKLGERRIVELERQKVLEDLQFLKWQSQFLEVRAPVGGIVLTKDVGSLAGKKFRAGDPFCEIAPTEELAVEILVPEDSVGFAGIGQDAYVYLNNNPLKGYKLRVEEIAPAAEALPRLGNVCRVKAKFEQAPEAIKVGMKGVGKIHTVTASPWFVVKRGVLVRWTRLSLYW